GGLAAKYQVWPLGKCHPRRAARHLAPSSRALADCKGETTVTVATRDELMGSLAELRGALPSMRFGQLIANMATVARGAVPGAIWEAEDEGLLAAMPISSAATIPTRRNTPARRSKLPRENPRRSGRRSKKRQRGWDWNDER